VALEKEVLRRLEDGPKSFEELKEIFLRPELPEILIKMEESSLIENRDGTWFITEKGAKKLLPRKGILVYLLVVPAICFFLLSAHFYMGYTGLQSETQELLAEKAAAEDQLNTLYPQQEEIQNEYTQKLATLEDEQETTAELTVSLTDVEEIVDNLQGEKDYLHCLETCSPDTFVTVDNQYIQAKVDELTSGLTSLRKKQEAVYTFVRDEIKDDEYLFRTGRMDFWEYPEAILRRGKGHYEDKFMLLLTMLRAAGTPSEHVKFIAAEVDGNDSWAWVEVYDGETWWILDPFEDYTFTSTPRDEFYREHKVKILWWFNDTRFAEG
jgi:predicted transglutaminase-like cysteine proteinase